VFRSTCMVGRTHYALAFVLAFCSLTYQLVIATELSRILGDAIFVFPGCVGVFILAKGIASAFWQRRPTRSSPLAALAAGELILTGVAATSVAVIRVCFTSAGADPWPDPLLVGLGLAALIGALTGQELPLLFHSTPQHAHHRRMLLWDYFAALIAALVFALVLLPRLGLMQTVFIAAAINLAAAGAILALERRAAGRLHRGLTVAAALVGAGLLGLAPSTGTIEHYLHEAATGASLRAAAHTPYHEALLFIMRRDCQPVAATDAEILANPDPYLAFVTLNGDVQFLAELSEPGDTYHALMVDPLLHFRPTVEHALVLGGGSGNAAAALLDHEGVTQVTMVEIDETFTELARLHPLLRAINGGALDNDRLTLIYDDAFTWVPQASDRFGVVLADFPAGFTVAGIRRLSLQFLRDLRRIVTEDGVAVFQIDAELTSAAINRFVRTAETAGWFPLVGRKRYRNPRDTEVVQLLAFADAGDRDQFSRSFYDSYCPSATDLRAASLCRTRYQVAEARGAHLSLYGAAGARDLWELITGKPYYKHRHLRFLASEVCRGR